MTKLTINIRDALRANLGNAITHVPCNVDVEELLDFNDLSTCDIDLHDHLAQNRMIGLIWSTADVKDRRPDLSDDQAWEVLQTCQRSHDCNYGITWETLDITAESLFGAKVTHRLERCQQALRVYSGDDIEANLVDFLADAMHWCDKNGRTFNDLLRTADEHFTLERSE
jgi:hypothetical protein